MNKTLSWSALFPSKQWSVHFLPLFPLIIALKVIANQPHGSIQVHNCCLFNPSWSLRPLWSWRCLVCKTVKTIPHGGVWMHQSFSATFCSSVGLSAAPCGTCSFLLEHFSTQPSVYPSLTQHSTEVTQALKSQWPNKKTWPSCCSLLWKIHSAKLFSSRSQKNRS